MPSPGSSIKTLKNQLMRILTALLLLFSLSACGLYYHTPVRQGNVLTPDQVARLEPGMTKQQVRYLMGTPLVASRFEDNRWDYVFYYRNTDARVRQSKIRLYFIDGRLIDIEGKAQFLQASHGGQLAPSNGQTHTAPIDAAGAPTPSDSDSATTTPDANGAAAQ